MAFEIRHLRSYVAVAEERHFGRAAERLHITQPALSRTIQQLEAELGGPVFKRSTRTVELTALGATFLPAARTAVASFDTAYLKGQMAARGEVATVLLGHTEVAIFGQLPRILHTYRGHYPNSTVTLFPGNTRENIARVISGEIDVALVTGLTANEELNCEPLWEEGSVVVMAAGHHLAKRRSIELKELAGEPFVMGPSKSWQAYRPLVEQACARMGFSPRIVQEADSSSALVQLVARDEGITIHPACIRNVTPPQVVVRELIKPLITVQTCLIRRRDNHSKAVVHFWRVAEECCRMPSAKPGKYA